MILFNCVPFQMGTSFKGKKLLPEGENSFLYEQFLIVWKITLLHIKLPQASKNPLVRLCLRVPQAAGQVKLWMISNVN